MTITYSLAYEKLEAIKQQHPNNGKIIRIATGIIDEMEKVVQAISSVSGISNEVIITFKNRINLSVIIRPQMCIYKIENDSRKISLDVSAKFSMDTLKFYLSLLNSVDTIVG